MPLGWTKDCLSVFPVLENSWMLGFAQIPGPFSKTAGCSGFNKGPLRITTSSQSQLEGHLFPSVTQSVWYSQCSVVQGLNISQFLWLVRIKQELLLCIGRFSAHLSFKDPSVLMEDTVSFSATANFFIHIMCPSAVMYFVKTNSLQILNFYTEASSTNLNHDAPHTYVCQLFSIRVFVPVVMSLSQQSLLGWKACGDSCVCLALFFGPKPPKFSVWCQLLHAGIW